MQTLRPAFAALVAVTLVLAGCGGASESGASDPAATGDAVGGDITVFAAASLRATFTELGTRFEAEHPGTSVEFSFAGSSDLATQLISGAPADVFASADTKNMTMAVDAGVVAGDPVDFASNTLTIVTAPGNPDRITSFADLANPDILTVICAPQVPCGAATAAVEAATGADIPAVSEESSVTDVLGKVTSGQADAGLVYVTDAAGAGDSVTAVPFPEASEAVNTYPVATLSGSENDATARAFAEFVTGPVGRDVLARAGFAAP
ncbi:molybdate ABC transporter substrate-binding protein [Rhodococcoides yunnanense]|uniref:Molybdate ABC transporter substrate-binding protein n=1 Tax=Rhodococcoides yunnanense TaxID=278209 RepID=A0ABU4BB27_9NOCA|nr:molybdate ABC transporter substrate-binding protein [Rhodococcus yunnanensis]MDV6261410.1 molybdate ABC transporter substrate-binding protein [Rhodococcus yunnanensis]